MTPTSAAPAYASTAGEDSPWQGATGAGIYGLQPRYMRERAASSASAPAADTADAAGREEAPVAWFAADSVPPGFDGMTAELRRRAVGAETVARLRLMPSVALPVIVTLTTLLWFAIAWT